MANEILQKTGTPIVWADATDFSGTNNGRTRTAQIDLQSLANGAARQGDKVDLGATRARQYAPELGAEFQSAPTAGNVLELWLSFSPSTAAGTGNAGGASGADGTYKAGEEDEWKQQLVYAGALVATNDGNTTPQYQYVGGPITALDRYVTPIVVNKSGQSLNTSDANEMFMALIPLIDEVQ